MSGKYTPLENYLRDLPGNQNEVMLSFEQIERILNSKLPPSAHESQKWWKHETEGNHVNKRSWSNAGWKIDNLNLNEKWVKLVRAVTARSPSRSIPSGASGRSEAEWEASTFKREL